MTGVRIYDPADGITYRHPGLTSRKDDVPSVHPGQSWRDGYTNEPIFALPYRDLTIGGITLPEVPTTIGRSH